MRSHANPNKKPNATMGQVRASRMVPDEGVVRRRSHEEERARRNERSRLLRALNRSRTRK